MAESVNDQVFERDSILLYCSEKKGFLYVGANDTRNATLTLLPVRDPQKPEIPYLAFGVFKLFAVPEAESLKNTKSDGNPLVFGRLVKLFNIASQKFVALSKNKSRETDSSVFVIRSPQGTESRGKDVHLFNEIRLESANNRGACLSFEYDLSSKSLQAHLKGSGMKFIVYRHAKESEISDEWLMACQPVMLHNLKRDGELSAGSCFLRLDSDKSDRTVECRRRTKVHGVERIPPQSGDTFWQLQLMDEPYSGRPLQWNDRCRIQHLPSQLYVTIIEVPGIKDMYQVALQELCCDSDDDQYSSNVSFILLHPKNESQNQDFDKIFQGSHLVFRHEATEREIAVPVTTKEIDLRHKFYSNNRRLNVFTVQKDALSDMTVFNIYKIPKEVVIDFYAATVWAYSLHKTAEKLRISENINFESMKAFKENMSAVVTWIQEGQSPSRRADMLRTLNVVEVFFGLLKDCSELVDSAEGVEETDVFRYRVMLTSVVDTMKKYIQIAKPKSRRYFIQDAILKPLFLKPTSRAAIEDVLSLLVKLDTVVADKMAEFIFKHNLDEIVQMERDSQGFLMALSSSSFTKNARKIQNILFLNMQNCPKTRTHEDEVNLETVKRSTETISQYSGTTIDRFWRTFEYKRLTWSEPLRGAGVRAIKMVDTPEVIQNMQENIMQHLRNNETIRVTKDSVSANLYTSQLLGILESLVNYGFYSTEEHLTIIPSLVDVLDGSTDYYPQRTINRLANRQGTITRPNRYSTTQEMHTRYKGTYENRPVIKIKTIGVRVLQKFHDILIYISIQRLLYDFKYLLEHTNFSLEESFPRSSEVISSSRQRYYEQLCMSLSEENLLSLPTTSHYTPPSESLMSLLDSSKIFDNFSIPDDATRRLDLLLDDAAYSVFSISESCKLVDILLDLLNYDDSELCLSAAKLLFEMHHKKSAILFAAQDVYLVDPTLSGFMRKVLPLACMTDKDKVFHVMLRGVVHQEANPHLLEILDELCLDCVEGNDENEPAVCHQSILYSSGLFMLILDYVLKYGSSSDKSHIKCKTKCYELLRRITRKNPKAQLKVFEDLTDLMKEKSCVFAMAELLTEAFSFNSEICVMLCNLDAGLKEFLTEAISSAHSDQHELVHIMNVVVMGNALCRNQVAQLIKEAGESDLSHLIRENKEGRIQLLCLKPNEGSVNDRSNLHLLLNIVDVLATCCTGEFLKSEIIAENIIPFDEILEVLFHPHIPLENKKPFIALLNWAFLETERDSLLYIKQLVMNENFKLHLEEIILLISAFLDDSHLMKLTEVHRNLQALGKRHFSVAGWMKYCSNSPIIITASKYTASLAGLLLFLLQGLIPTISMLSDRFNGFGNYPEMLQIIMAFGECLMKFQKILSEPDYVETTMTCLNKIGLILRGNVSTEEYSRYMLSIHRSTLLVQTVLPENAKSKCVLLNEKLQEFVINYQMACSGSLYSGNVRMFNPYPFNPGFDKLVDLFELENCSPDCDEPSIKNLLKLLDIIYVKIHRQIKGKERAELEKSLHITLHVLTAVLQRKVIMVEQAENQRMRRVIYEQQLKPLQDHLLKIHAHEKTMKFLSHPVESISYQVIILMKQLLFFGNSQAQEMIGDLLSSDRSRVLFFKFRNILEGVGAPSTDTQASIPVYVSDDPMAKIRKRSYAVPPTPPIQFFKRPFSQEIKDVPLEQLQPTCSTSQFLESVVEEVEVDVKTKGRSIESLGATGETTPLMKFEEKTTVAEAEDIGNQTSTTEEHTTVHENNTIFGSLLQPAVDHISTSIIDDEVDVVLDVVSFLCDGQRKELQDTFGRETTHSSGSNIINQITLLLESMAECINLKNISTARKAFQALIELCAGNFRNQEVAFRVQALASINSFLKIDPSHFDMDLQTEIMCVKCSAVELLEVMLEETDPSSSELARKIYAQLILKNLMMTMIQMWRSHNTSSHRTDKSFWRNGLIRSYHTIKMIAHYKGIRPEEMVKDKFRLIFGRHNTEVESMLYFCKEWSHSIEIEYKSKGILTRVYFPFPPKSHLVLADKETVCNNLSRESEDEKLRDLLHWTKSLRKRSHWKKKVDSQRWLKWITHFSTIRHIILIMLTFILNILLIVSVRTASGLRSEPTQIKGINFTITEEQQWYYPATVVSLGLIHLFLSIWMVAEFYINEYPHIRLSSPLLNHIVWHTSRRRPLIISFFNKLFRCQISVTKPQPYSHFERSIVDTEAIYRLIFVLCSFLSLALEGSLYPICLYYIFLKSDFAITVWTSVTKSAKSLVIILLLVLMILVMYAVIAFYFFNDFFHNDSQNLRCNDMFECLITVIRLGSLSNPPLGDNISTVNVHIGVAVLRLLYSISFFIIVTTLGLNVVIAILVDNFSALREKKNQIEQDKLNVCTICGLTKSDLDHRAKMYGGFRKHVKEAHSMWNYIYFALYLDYRDRNDHNALEKYIFEAMLNHEIDFFPRGKAKDIVEDERRSGLDGFK